MNINRVRLSGLLGALILYMSFVGASSSAYAAVPNLNSVSEKYAVLIGVSDYIHLDQQFDLVGPKNDVRLVADLLKQKGFDQNNVTLLAEGLGPILAPTRKNILAVLDDRLDKTKQGDFVYLHFSGHGSQQPGALDEIDGLDEIFLPSDTKAWNRQKGAVENAIVDDEIAGYVDAFRDKGVFVWLVFDSCHSGTMTRGLWQNRKVTPAQLGIPETTQRSVPGKVEKRSTPVEFEATGKGGYVAFFAAQTTEETPEMDLPKRSEHKTRYGLFTYNLMQALATSRGGSYRQLAQKVVQNYASQPWFGSSPMFVGDGLDRTVFDHQESRASIDQWAVIRTPQGFEISAGYLQGIAEGAVLALLTEPDAPDSEAIGYVEVSEVQSVFSSVTPVSHQPSAATQPIPAMKKMPPFAYARRLNRHAGFQLSVGVLKSPSEPTASQAIKALKASAGNITWVEATETADVRLLVLNGQIYILNDAEDLPCPMGPCGGNSTQPSYFSVPLKGDEKQISDKLKAALAKVAKALNLIRVGDVMEGEALATELIVVRSEDGVKETFDRFEVPTLYEGDQLSLYIANYLEAPLDITVLFVGSDYSIDVVFPRGKQFNRFMFEEELEVPLGSINVQSTGMERLVIISSEALNSAVPQDFGFLAQKGLVAGQRALDGDLGQLLKAAGFGFETGFESENTPGARGGMGVQRSLRQKGSIHTISWATSAN